MRQKIKDKYYSLFNSIDEAFCIVELVYDDEGNAIDFLYLEVNPSFKQHTQLENVVGKLGSEVAPNTESYWVKTYDEVLKTGQPMRFENYNKSTGRWYSAYVSRIGNHGSCQVAIVFSDTTERKRLEQHLAILSEISKDLVELDNIAAAMDIVGEKIGKHFGVPWCSFAEFTDDLETGVSSYGWNAENAPSLKGIYHMADMWTPELAAKSNAGEIIVVDDTQKDARLNAKSLAALGIISCIAVPLARKGKFRFMLAIMDTKPRQWRADEIELQKEITGRIWSRVEKARAEQTVHEFSASLEKQVAERTQQLKQTIDQLESFNYIASHDLQEPLRKIRTYAGLLKEHEQTDPEQNAYIDKIDDSSKRMSQLIESLLSYSRLAHASNGFKPTNLNQILGDVIADYEILIENKKAVIQHEVLPTVRAISFQMHQLFSNIIGNSLKFSEKQPFIQISSRIIQGNEIRENIPEDLVDKQFAEITFRDNGIGFDSRYSEKIFQLFQRLHNKSVYPGTGIGLSIVRRIIQQHKGSIKADGVVNEGAVFTVYLPVAI